MSLEIGIAPCSLRDLAEGIQQQMYFWGQDVLRPGGNYLVKQGFVRLPSKGAKGTSCYQLDWQGGRVELYGSCAGWYGRPASFAFLRPRRRCVIWRSEVDSPIPGEWDRRLIVTEATREELYQASLPFLDWLIAYEEEVLAEFGSDYREENFRRYRKVPKAKVWLKPELALGWFRDFRERPLELRRPKQLTRERV